MQRQAVMPPGLRINIGCGSTPTKGYVNFDNSLTVRAARVPGLPSLLGRAGLLGEHQLRFASVARDGGIRWADASHRIPLPDGSVAVAYSSHMLEHLPRSHADSFLREVRRVLAPSGVLRLGVPDLGLLLRVYQEKGDADAFVAGSLLADDAIVSWKDVLRHLVVGARHHAWMYDARSLMKLLDKHGFRDVVELPAGQTTIPDPGDLDLRERAAETVYVEARNPSA